MDFDFYEQYKHSSNIDLLLIVKQPGKYQPEAVDAAKMLLKERDVSEDEEQQATDAIHAEPLRLFKRRFRKDEDKSLSELLDPLTHPNTKKAPLQRSVLFGLIVVTLYFSWKAFIYLRYYSYYFFGASLVDYLFFISLFDLAVIVAMVILLWKKHPWGWRLLLVYNLFSVLNVILNSVMFPVDLGYMNAWSIITHLTPTVLHALCLLLMWRDGVAAQFSIYKADKAKTLKWGIILFAVIASLVILATSDIKIFS